MNNDAIMEEKLPDADTGPTQVVLGREARSVPIDDTNNISIDLIL